MADRNKFPSEKYNMEVPEYMIFGTKRSDQRFTH